MAIIDWSNSSFSDFCPAFVFDFVFDFNPGLFSRSVGFSTLSWMPCLKRSSSSQRRRPVFFSRSGACHWVHPENSWFFSMEMWVLFTQKTGFQADNDELRWNPWIWNWRWISRDAENGGIGFIGISKLPGVSFWHDCLHLFSLLSGRWYLCHALTGVGVHGMYLKTTWRFGTMVGSVQWILLQSDEPEKKIRVKRQWRSVVPLHWLVELVWWRLI